MILLFVLVDCALPLQKLYLAPDRHQLESDEPV
jgi:hypothetical protein